MDNSSYTVFIIDDDEVDRLALSGPLVNAGFKVIETDSGKNILDKINDEKPDVVITDIIMPDIEGIEMIVALKEQYPELPVIAVTGTYYGEKYLNMAATLGADRCLLKPADPSTLLGLVSQLLNQ